MAIKLKANTPAKRIGLIFIVFSTISYLLLAAYWNITQKVFFEEIDIISSITSEEPQAKEGSFWFRSKDGWLEIDKTCNGDEPHILEGKTLIATDCIMSEQKDKFIVTGKQWDASSWKDFMYFLAKQGILGGLFISFWSGVFLRIGTFDFCFFLLKKIFIGIKKGCIWIKTGHWERKPKLTKKNPKLSSCLKKWIYGTVVVSAWISFELTLKYNSIKLGGIPYGLLVFFWLWTFSKATGLDLGFKKKSLENKDTQSSCSVETENLTT